MYYYSEPTAKGIVLSLRLLLSGLLSLERRVLGTRVTLYADPEKWRMYVEGEARFVSGFRRMTFALEDTTRGASGVTCSLYGIEIREDRFVVELVFFCS